MSEDGPKVIPVILCGGAGTRLWPSSREAYPKQFLPLIGDRSTFELTLERVSDRSIFGDPLIVTADAFRFLTADQLARAKRRASILLEPARRDSGPAIAIAAEAITRRSPEALMLVLAADHLVEDVESFVDTVVEGIPAARQGMIVTFGITPTKPATGYGYIAAGETIAGKVRMLERFIEKPTEEVAKELIAAGNLWNSGNFLMRADVFLSELEAHEPAMRMAALEAVAKAKRDDLGDVSFVRVDEAAFKASPAKSVDYAVMERTERSVVVEAPYAWSDLGSWHALWEAAPHDGAGNVKRGDVTLINAKNAYVWSEDGVRTAVVGLDDIVVVTTHDAVLVARREVNSEMKTLVEALSKEEPRLVNRHTRNYRRWGWVQDKDRGERHEVKRILVQPGKGISMHRHLHRSEHWIVVQGTATVIINDEERLIRENQSAYIAVGAWHQMANDGKIPLEIIEVRSGPYLGEDDIIRKDGSPSDI
jgi:mannose-1-phosphate guanylyltransferase / mannose-6-phosphate isomerase